MHKKQISNKNRFLDQYSYKNRSNQFQYHHNKQSSLEESPIATKVRDDSDHSSQHYLYPQSLQAFNNSKGSKIYDLKQIIIQFLYKLQDWLVELSLTDSFSHQISEQLEPIIEEIKETNYNESGSWLSNLPERYNQNSLLKESQNNYPCSIIINERPPEMNRNNSILIHESRQRSQIWLFNENQKNLIRLYFKKYFRLLQNCLLKINRYSGQKKLKFLLQTNMRNIFSQTLRISYDLKLIEFKLKEQRIARVKNSRNTYLNVLKIRVEQIFRQKGGMRKAFKLLSKIYYDEVKNDNVLVSEMINKMDKLCKIYSKTNRQNLQHITYLWRESAYKLKIEEDIYLLDCIRLKLEHILSGLTELGDSATEFNHQWRSNIEVNLNNLCFQIFNDEDCFFMQLQQMLDQRYSKREKHTTLAQFLQSLSSSDSQSRISKNRSFLNEITVEQLKSCILSGQIHKSDKSEHNILLIPIKPVSGIFFVRLEPSSSSNQFRTPMRIVSFRKLLRIVQLITPILEDFMSSWKRVEARWEQVQKNDHYSLLFKEFLKLDFPKADKGHMQVQRGSQQIQIDSNRLQSSSETAKIILDRYGIDNLMIYHSQEKRINEMPCIVYGDSSLALSQKYIIQSIYEQLMVSGKKILVVNRNSQSYNILPYEVNNIQVGIVHYTCQNAEKVDNQMILQCLVPLIQRSEGKINCQRCKVSLRLPKINDSKIEDKQLNIEPLKKKPELIATYNLITCNSLLEIQDECSKLLRSKGNFFHKLIYKLDLSDIQNFYTLNSDGKIEHYALKENEKILHKQTFIESYSNMSSSSIFAKIAYSNPCFSNHMLHIYQSQNDYEFKLVAIPIKNKENLFGYLLAGFYETEQINIQYYIQYLKEISDCLSLNQNIFKPIKLQSKQMQSYFLQHQHIKVNYKHNQVIFKDIQSTVCNKLSATFQTLSNKIIEKMQNIPDLAITVFKLGLKQKNIKIISSTKNNDHKRFKVSQQIFQFLMENSIVSTHEKYYSNQCRIKKDNFNRTIKPLKLQKINNISFFLPLISPEANQQLLGIVEQKYKLKGLIANQYYSLVEEIDTKITGIQPQRDQMYTLIRLIQDLTHSQMYVLMLQQNINKKEALTITDTPFMQDIKKAFLSSIQKTRMNQVCNSQKGNLIEQLSRILNQKYTINNTIQSFLQYSIRKKQTFTRFFNKLSQFLADKTHKNIRYLSLMGNAFCLLKVNNHNRVQKYKKLAQRLVSITKHYFDFKIKRKAFNSIYNSISVPTNFNSFRFVNCLYKTSSKIVKSIIKDTFQQIKIVSQIHHFNLLRQKQISLWKLASSASYFQKRHHYQHFFSQIEKCCNQFTNSFNLIIQEYEHIEFNSMQSFIIFANERFKTLLNHIHFGLIQSIQIGVIIDAYSQTLIFKLNQDNKVIQIATQKNGVTQSENLHYESIPILSSKSSKNFIIHRITTKQSIKNEKDYAVIKNAILSGVVPSFQRYVQRTLEKAQKFWIIVQNCLYKQIWNGSGEESQKIYAFGKKVNHDVICHKIRAFSAIKHFKRSQMITELKLIRNAINEQTRQFYRFEYEYNSINSALSSVAPLKINKQDAQIFSKYDDFVSKEKLRQTRDATERIQFEYEKKNLNYQIKSKTFATSKIIMFVDKREKREIENANCCLMNQNQQNSNISNIQSSIVEAKMQISSRKEQIKKIQKRQKVASARAIYLLITKLKNQNMTKQKHRAFKTIAWPKQSKLRI